LLVERGHDDRAERENDEADQASHTDGMGRREKMARDEELRAASAVTPQAATL
jgi:hypothetical protein